MPREVIWHIGPPTARTDPFTTWTAEIMMARYGIRVRRVHRAEGADVVRASETDWVLTPTTVSGVMARQLVTLLASSEARAHARNLAGDGSHTI